MRKVKNNMGSGSFVILNKKNSPQIYTKKKNSKKNKNS